MKTKIKDSSIIDVIFEINKILLVTILFSLLLTEGCSYNDIGDLAVAKLTAYNGPRFTAVGDSGIIYYSYDGKKWEQTVSPTTNNLNAITYGDGKFVAVGIMGTVVRSYDAKEWEIITIPGAIPFYCIAYGNGNFITAGQWMSMDTQVQVSTDGVTWNDRKILSGNQSMNGIAFANGRFYTVGNSGEGWYTDDAGLTWNASNQPVSAVYYSVIYAGGKFTSFGFLPPVYITDSNNAAVFSSIIFTGTVPSGIYAAIYGSGKYIAVGASGGSSWSNNSIDWFIGTTGTVNPLRTVTYGGGLYVAAGDSGTIIYSSDGENWFPATVTPTTGLTFRGIVYRQ